MIILKKNSDFFSFVVGQISAPIEGSLINYLAEDIKIENGVTFGQFFNIILKHHKEYSKFFISYLNGIPLSEYIDEFNKPSIDDEKHIIDYISVEWGITYVFPEEIKNPIYVKKIPDFVGRKYEKKSIYEEDVYSLEYSPLNKLKKYPLKLIPDDKIVDIHNLNILFTLKREFTVYDVLAAIFNEITFLGNPIERNESLQKLKNKFDDSIKNFKNEKTKSFSLYDILKKMKIDPPKDNEIK